MDKAVLVDGMAISGKAIAAEEAGAAACIFANADEHVHEMIVYPSGARRPRRTTIACPGEAGKPFRSPWYPDKEQRRCGDPSPVKGA